jgi:hypothetical protein
MSDTSVPLDELDQPDPDTDGACRMLADPPLSKETLYRLARRGEIAGYLLSGRRLWRRASLRAYKERCIERGTQFGPPPRDGKRRPGRPKKPRPEQEPSLRRDATVSAE